MEQEQYTPEGAEKWTEPKNDQPQEDIADLLEKARQPRYPWRENEPLITPKPGESTEIYHGIPNPQQTEQRQEQARPPEVSSGQVWVVDGQRRTVKEVDYENGQVIFDLTEAERRLQQELSAKYGGRVAERAKKIPIEELRRSSYRVGRTGQESDRQIH